MRNKLTSELYKIKISRTTVEKIELMNDLQEELINHFYNKAAKSKHFYQIYKYASIVRKYVVWLTQGANLLKPCLTTKNWRNMH